MADGAAAETRSRAPAKSASAFRTISEVSADLDVPQHVLRFWETKFPQIRPLKRGGGRRYYRPDDVELLRRIQSLLYKEGYTIKGVQRLLKESRGVVPPPGKTPDAADAAGSTCLFDEAMEVAEPDPAEEEGPDAVLDISADPATAGPATAGPATAGPASADPDDPPSPAAPGLSAEKRRALEAILAELIDLRRMLDRA
ncbi:MerR family transcriptional regulator [Rhodospirillum centenum]|uniref:Transcriptional regulator, MerR family protein n=1 Tax=Rhodospirillum centenum (strain ATCC 51521 / SW) TaxID=414684 RepID=B6IMR3_RHOCS|nr:MerR family transcriptional regulator [Rhodospirillum centenum]ACI98729.1 transcriptional regulator, MerR family protein [Rhodospirillum centenum SW]